MDDATQKLVDGLRLDAGNYGRMVRGEIEPGETFSWDQSNVRAWEAADALEAAQRPPVSGGVDWSDTDRPHCVRCGERIWAGQKMTVLPSGLREHQDCACPYQTPKVVRGRLDALPEVPDDAVIKAMAEGICESLLDLETGPLSDAPYRHAEVNDDGHLELFEALGDWPSAVIDAPQLTRAAYAALRGAMQ